MKTRPDSCCERFDTAVRDSIIVFNKSNLCFELNYERSYGAIIHCPWCPASVEHGVVMWYVKPCPRCGKAPHYGYNDDKFWFYCQRRDDSGDADLCRHVIVMDRKRSIILAARMWNEMVSGFPPPKKCKKFYVPQWLDLPAGGAR